MGQYVDKLRHSGEGTKDKKTTNLAAHGNKRDGSNETPIGNMPPG